MANLVDSSVWVALFLDFDSQHAKAERVFMRLKGKICLPYCVASEAITILAYKHSKEQANKFIEFIGTSQDITSIDDDFADETEFYKSIQAKISFTDAALLFLSKKLKAKLVTFDRQLENLSRRY